MLQSGLRVGSYEVISALGAGGMGEVWRARDTRLGRDVALKVLPDVFASDSERLARFEREAKILATLNHPNIASIYGLEEASGVRALVLELVEGPTLAARIARNRLPVAEALRIAAQIAEALEAAHDEMLTGRRAFTGKTVTETLAAVLGAEPDWSALPDDTPPGTRRLLRRCLQKDVRERLRDAGDARLELADSDEPPPATRRTTRASTRWWSVATLGAVLVALTLAAFAARSWLAGGPRPAEQWRGERLGGPPSAFGPRVSPGGQMVAFEAQIDGLTQVGVMMLRSGQWTILTSDRSRGAVQDVAWAADGTSVYFDRVTDVPAGIFRVPALGGEPRLVLDRAMTPVPLADGSLIVVRVNESRQRQLFRFRPETGSLEPLNAQAASSVLEPAVRAFRDGHELLFYGRPVEADVGRDDLYTLDLGSGLSAEWPEPGPPMAMGGRYLWLSVPRTMRS
jgi:hypothetical protein